MITKSLATDFGGNLNPAQLKQEIVANVGITTALDYINVSGDVVNINFVSTLSGGETTILNSIITAHVPGNLPKLLFNSQGSLNTSTTLQANLTGDVVVNLPNVNDTLISRNSNDFLINKTISGTNNTLTIAASNISSLFGVAAGGFNTTSLSAGNILQGNGVSGPTATKPAPTGAIVGTTDSQTLTNKTIDAASNTLTITSAAFSTPVNVNRGGTGLTTIPVGNILVGNGTSSITSVAAPASTIVDISSVQTLTNKTITDSTNNITATQLRSVIPRIDEVPIPAQTLVTSTATAAKWQLTTGITWKGIWNISAYYAQNDMVTYLNTSWICILTNTNQVPPNPTYWTQAIDNIRWLGTWNSGTAYRVNDSVISAGITYICIVANTNSIPPNANWNQLTVATIGGTDKQVIYNAAGSLATASKLSIDTGYAVVSKTSTAPTTPASGSKIFSQLRAGYQTLSVVDREGRVDLSQSSLFARQFAIYSPHGNSTTVFVFNFSITATGTATARNNANTNNFTAQRRIEYRTAASAGSSAGINHSIQSLFIGDSTTPGGFLLVVRFGMSSAADVAGQRSFVGLYASTSAIGNVDPSSLTNIIGFGVDSADSQWTFMHNDASGIATKDSLTGTFPARSLSTDMMEARIYGQANSTNIYYSLGVVGGSFYESVATTDIPAATTLLTPHIWTNNGATALAASIDIVFMYLECENN